MKDYFLVCRGEFYQSLLDEISKRGIFDTPPSSHSEQQLNDGPWQRAAQICGLEDDPNFNRICMRLEKSFFTFNRFLASNICTYESARPDAVVLLGGAEHHSGRSGRITLSGGAREQIGSVWYASRKDVERGFVTKFRFQLTKLASVRGGGSRRDGGGGGRGSDSDEEQDTARSHVSRADSEAAMQGLADEVKRVREREREREERNIMHPSWIPDTHGFSFVIQNTSMSALPVVETRPWNGNKEQKFYIDELGQKCVVKYGFLPNALQIYFHVVRPTKEREKKRKEERYRSSRAADGVEEHKGERETEFDINYVSVYRHENGNPQPVYLGSTQALSSESPSSSTSSSSSTSNISVGARRAREALSLLSDGKEHLITVEYTAPGRGAGSLNIYIDDVAVPLLKIPMSLPKLVSLDGGRAWVGFTAATGFGRSEGGDSRVVRSRRKYVRDIYSWDFKEAESLSVQAWRNIRLSYEVDAPIDLVLLTDDFDRYSALFRFLFLVKRVQTRLQKAWSGVMRTREAERERINRLMPVYALRAKMQFFIDNLQYYLLEDVIEVQFNLLMNKLNESEDFDTVHQAHEEYISQLAKQCFLHARVVSSSLYSIFDICFDFCKLLSRHGGDVRLSDMERLEKDFQRQLSFLFTILSRRTGLYAAPHLAQLVLRIDFNKFLSETSKTERKTPTVPISSSSSSSALPPPPSSSSSTSSSSTTIPNTSGTAPKGVRSGRSGRS